MALKIATWNINSVRLRMPLISRFVEKYRPDIVCLQETKCRDSEFPASDFGRLGYDHLAINGQKGYHGVCIASRFPIHEITKKEFCEKGDARHVAATFSAGTAFAIPLTLHNFYVPAGGDEPDPLLNEKFAHKLAFLREVGDWMAADRCAAEHAMVVGDLNIAPLENDVWNHKALLKVVSHTPVEVELLENVQRSGAWVDSMRQHVSPREKLFTWWSYRSPNWEIADKGRRLDHIWTSAKLAPHVVSSEIVREARGWERPSDHVPVILTLE
jgi:exodeoxyribonuclease-3